MRNARLDSQGISAGHPTPACVPVSAPAPPALPETPSSATDTAHPAGSRVSSNLPPWPPVDAQRWSAASASDSETSHASPCSNRQIPWNRPSTRSRTPLFALELRNFLLHISHTLWPPSGSYPWRKSLESAPCGPQIPPAIPVQQASLPSLNTAFRELSVPITAQQQWIMKENRFSFLGSHSVFVPVLGSVPLVPVEADAGFEQHFRPTRSHLLYISQIYNF